MEDLRRAAAALARALADLDAAVPSAPPVQEDYSFRCLPQVLACAHRAIEQVLTILAVELNSANDNPLLFPPAPPDPAMDARAYRAWLAETDADGHLTEAGAARMAACLDSVLGGGNFHGEPLAIAADYLAIAVAEVGNIAERRIAHLVDENASNGLPAFLTDDVGLNSGFMMPQYTAAALASENKVLCHPASVDSIPTSANAEDHNSMGTHAARKLAQVVDHVRWIVAIELLTAHQAIQFREPLEPAPAVRAVRAELRAAGLDAQTHDRVLYTEMRKAYELIRDGAIGA
jgi:histidine ammonia-lyase